MAVDTTKPARMSVYLAKYFLGFVLIQKKTVTNSEKVTNTRKF